MIQNSRLYALAAVILFVLLGVFQIKGLLTTSLGYDDAYFASVAKNLAMGVGYATAYHKPETFDPGITTGPLLILPAALLIKIFGNGYWVPGLVTVLFNIGSLLVLFFLCRRTIENPEELWRTVVITLSLLAVFTLSSHFTRRLWFMFLGEMPGALLTVIGIVFLYSAEPSCRRSFFGGALLGLGVLTKTVMLLALAAVCVLIPFSLCRQRAWRTKLAVLLLIAAGAAAPLFAFDVYKLVHVGSIGNLIELKQREYLFFKTGGSGLNLIASNDRLPGLVDNIKQNAPCIMQYLRTKWQNGLLLVLCLASLTLVLIRPPRHTREWLGVILICCFLAHFCWWIVLSRGWIRYLAPGLIYCAFGLGFIISSLPGKWNRSFFICLILILFFNQLQSLSCLIPKGWNKSERLTALLDSRDFLSNRINEGDVLMGCGWWANRDLEYLLPQSGNFVDCLRSDTNPDKVRGVRLLVRSDYWNWEKSDRIENITQACERDVIFVRDPFVISACAPPANANGAGPK